MVREQQQPVMRDFLGLGNMANSAHQEEDCAQFEVEEEGGRHDNPYFGTFRGWSGGFGAVNGPAGGIHSNGNIAFTGVKHPVWNKGVTMRQFCALRNSLDERYMERSADSHGLAHTRQRQVPLPGTIPRTGGFPGGTGTRVLASDVCAKQSGAQLTILYAGNVNVYDDIPVGKAQAIMHLAASGNSWPTNVLYEPFGASHALAAQGLHQPGNLENLHFNVQIGQTQLAADQASQSSPHANKQLECSTPSTASSALSPQPVVPRALPQARKASLARFLEKRKERVQMMSPYLTKKFSSEQSILPGDLTSGSNYGAAFSKPYDEYYKKPVSMTCAIEDHMGTCNGMPSCDMPAEE